ncbi:hypothetical protein [Nocardiopsis gilva]|nr:hypothetical protein [Nocardiopsis gilva]
MASRRLRHYDRIGLVPPWHGPWCRGGPGAGG